MHACLQWKWAGLVRLRLPSSNSQQRKLSRKNIMKEMLEEHEALAVAHGRHTRLRTTAIINTQEQQWECNKVN